MCLFNGKSRRVDFQVERKNNTMLLQNLWNRNYSLSFVQLRGKSAWLDHNYILVRGHNFIANGFNHPQNKNLEYEVILNFTLYYGKMFLL